MNERKTIIIDARLNKQPLSEKMRGGDLAWEGIEEMAGWKNLTQRQRAMIRASRMVQKRSERMPKTGNLDWSNQMIQQWFCHYSVRCLEREEVVPYREYLYLMGGAKTGDFWGGYFEDVKWSDDPLVFDTLTNESFPQVVHIGRKIEFGEKRESSEMIIKNEETVQMKHSCLALGRNEKGDVMVWEKIAERHSFNYTSIRDVVERYPQADRFALRPLGRRNKQ